MLSRREVKRRIENLTQLPTSPRVIAPALSAFLAPASATPSFHEVVRSDPGLAAGVLRAFPAAQNRGGAAESLSARQIPFPEAAGLSANAAGETVLSAALDYLAAADGNEDALDALWRRAVATAFTAQCLAENTDGVEPADAYLAGLLHNTGKLALMAACPEAVAALLDEDAQWVADQSLENEQQALGVDHTLAGKWLGERWRFPKTLCDVVWLHHHPLEVLERHGLNVPLIWVVQVAHRLCTVPPGAAEQALGPDAALPPGLDPGMVLVARKQAERLTQARLACFDGGSGRSEVMKTIRQSLPVLLKSASPDNGPAAHAAKRAARLRILHAMNVRLQPGQSLDEILDVFVDAVQRGLALGPGICCIVDAFEENLVARTWQSPDEPARPLVVDMERGENPALQELRALGLGKPETGAAGGHTGEVSRRGGLVVVPIMTGSRSLGQLIIDTENTATPELDAALPDLILFADACATAVARQHAEDRLVRQNEDIVMSLRREVAPAGLGAEAKSRIEPLKIRLRAAAKKAETLAARVGRGGTASALEGIARDCRAAGQMLAGLEQSSQGIELDLEPVSLTALARDAIGELEDEWTRHGIDISEQYAASLPKAMADPDRLGHAIQQTVRFMADRLARSGGLLSVRTVSADEGGSARLDVSDTGPRPDPGLLQAIAKPGVYHLSGGEAILEAKRIIHAHGGRLEASCPDGAGLRVAVVLPAAAPAAPEPVAPAASAPPEEMPFDLPGDFPPEAPVDEAVPFDAAAAPVPSAAQAQPIPEHDSALDEAFAAFGEPQAATATAQAASEPSKQTVLVVDDDANVREILHQVLDMRGYEVRTATDGVEAMAQITVNGVDLVLLDLMMPRKSGLDVLAELRMRRAAPPVIVMTGSKNAENIREALHNGALACLQKPFELRELLSTVESVLET